MDDLHGSDHYPIKIETATDRPQRQRRYNISRANWKQYKETVYIAGNIEQLTIQERYEKLQKHIIDIANRTIPKTNPDIERPVPWWTPECGQLRQERKTALRKYQRTGLLVDKIIYKRARAKAQYFINNIKRKSWQEYISKINIDTPTSKVWRRIRKISRKYPTTHPPCLKVGMNIISDPTNVCEVMAQHYSRVSSTDSYTAQFNRERLLIETEMDFEELIEEDYNAPIQMIEMKMILRDTRDSAPGEDLITYSMVRNLHETALTELHSIINELWKTGTFVDAWRRSVVLSFLKPGKDPSLPTSYRPVSLTSTLCKLMEKVANLRLVRSLNKKTLCCRTSIWI